MQFSFTGLEPGVHTAYVNAYDSKCPDKGSLFEIPVTVVKPEPLNLEPRPYLAKKEIFFGPGEIKRHFIQAPKEATWAVVRVNSEEKAATGKFILHTVQLVPGKSSQAFNQEKMFSLPENGEWTYGLPIKGEILFSRIKLLTANLSLKCATSN